MKISIGLLIGCLAIGSAYAASDNNKVKVPFRLGKGKVLFELNCSGCHGKQLSDQLQCNSRLQAPTAWNPLH